MKKVILVLMYAFLSMSLSSCDAGDKGGKTPPLSIPKGTALVKFIDKDGNSQTMLPNGQKLEDCVFCPEGATKKCAKDTSKKYCKGVVNATINNVKTSVVIQSSINPICWTEVENGKARQTCVCFPGDNHALCK